MDIIQMINKERGRIQLVCDECEEFSTGFYDSDDFSWMIREAKEDDWLITKEEDDDVWTHVCPDCVSKLPRLNS